MDTMQVLAVRNAEMALDKAISALEIVAESINDLPADHIVDIGAKMKRLADMVDFSRKNINSHIIVLAGDAKELRNAHFIATIVEATRVTLDTNAAKEALGAEWCAAHSKVSTSQSVRYKA